MNRSLFYTRIRKEIFSGKLAQSQVDGMEAILDEWDQLALTDLRQLAYMLATVYHETAKTMQPIEEYGRGKGRAYGKVHPPTGKVYYGRGFVQLTWWYNYEKMGKILGVDLLHQPELALRLDISTRILFEGMLTRVSAKGDFTGKHLDQYFNAKTEDWINARRIINGLDKAELIAAIARKFYQALKK